MNRLMGVIVGAIILILVGYFMGSRPVGGLKSELEVLKEKHAVELSDIRTQASQALGEGYLWQARAQLLVAAQDIGANNFGTAANRVAKAISHLQEARSLPNMVTNVGEIEAQIAGALKSVKALEPNAEGLLLKLATELGALLERKQT